MKYYNKPADGFHSKKEARRAQELQLLEKIGAISNLKYQTRWELVPKQKGERSVVYVDDFNYWDNENGVLVVEDTKGMKTPAYVIKRKLMLWVHGIRILET